MPGFNGPGLRAQELAKQRKADAIVQQQENDRNYYSKSLPLNANGTINAKQLAQNASTFDPARGEASINFARSETQRQNQYQTMVSDMQKTGINPGVLFAGGGGQVASPTNNQQANTSQKISGALGKAQLENIKSQTFLNKANAISGLVSSATGSFSNVAKGLQGPASIIKNTTNQFSRHYHK